jgi:DNA-binding transcriptional regulator LsrR (DeoR family)
VSAERAGRRTGAADDPAPTADLVGQVARLFFEQQLTKVEIAARLAISRFRVARLLDRALADGVVRIEFRDAPAQDRTLGRLIEERFGVGRCVVAAADDPRSLARLGAEVVDGLLDPGESIGIAWGSTVARVVQALPARQDPSIDVVQLAGSSTSLDAGTDPGDLTRVLAERLGARHHRIHAPAFVESPELRTALVRQPEVAATVRRFDEIAIAVLGIGAFGAGVAAGASARDGVKAGTARAGAAGAGAASSSLLRSGALGPAEIDELARLGAVGDLLVHPFTADGRFVAPDLAARAIAISIDELRRVPTVVAVAAGAPTVGAIRGALATGVIGVLVTDAATAEGILDAPAAPALSTARRTAPTPRRRRPAP